MSNQPATNFNTGTTGTALDAAATGFQFVLNNANYSAVLQVLDDSTNVNILATPKVFTSNNQQATINIQQFVRDYTMQSADEGRILKRTEAGCVFLSGNDCNVYEARPASCQTFPNVVRGNGSIPSRMWEFVDRATYCPIVYNWMEAVKEETGFAAKP